MTLRPVVGFIGACAVIVSSGACEQSMSPFHPSPLTSGAVSPGSTMLVNPNQATAVANAIGNCRGPVLLVLKALFGGGTLVSFTDDGSTFSFGLTTAGHSSSHTIEYSDDAPPAGLSCGDTVTAVDGIEP